MDDNKEVQAPVETPIEPEAAPAVAVEPEAA